MRKNKMMRAASGLLVATLLTTSAISGTFAKYTTSSTGTDSARVAKWGFNDTSSITLTDLFKNAYTDNTNGETVKSNETTEDVIAPGTAGSATFDFKYSGATAKPEVAYTFNVSTEGSSCTEDIKNNKNIQWNLDNGTWGTWDALMTSIQALDGNVADDKYAAGTLPNAFNQNSNEHTVSWQWIFDDTSATGATEESIKAQDTIDTAMGNKDTLDNVTLKITITATQID